MLRVIRLSLSNGSNQDQDDHHIKIMTWNFESGSSQIQLLASYVSIHWWVRLAHAEWWCDNLWQPGYFFQFFNKPSNTFLSVCQGATLRDKTRVCLYRYVTSEFRSYSMIKPYPIHIMPLLRDQYDQALPIHIMPPQETLLSTP